MGVNLQQVTDEGSTTTHSISVVGLTSGNGINSTSGRSVLSTASTVSADTPTLDVKRTTTHTGGTPGYVNFAIKGTSVVKAGVTNFEWAVLAQLENYSTIVDGSENSAFYAQSIKNSTGSTWASAIEIIDRSISTVATGQTVGQEISCVSAPATFDDNYQRNAQHNIIKLSGNGETEWGRGYWHDSQAGARTRECFSNSSTFTKAVFYNKGSGKATANDPTPTFIRDNGSGAIGINLTGATYSTGKAVILGGTTNKPNITLTTNGTVYAVNTAIQPVSSERRLKENIDCLDSYLAWETIKNTPFYGYNFIGEDTLSYGPMADEVPEDMCVDTGRTDDQGAIHTYDNGLLQARLFVALQEALKRIETLEEELTKLKPH